MGGLNKFDGRKPMTHWVDELAVCGPIAPENWDVLRSHIKIQHHMTHKEALEHLATGGKVKLPEWTGYWFEHPDQPGKVWAFTKHGDVVPAWAHRMDMIMREDWQEVTSVGLGFDWAINALQAGKKVQRSGWNGKGMHLWLKRGCHYAGEPGPLKGYISNVDASVFDKLGTDHPTEMPVICMLAADKTIVTGWLASQTDILATDWQLAD